VENLQGRVALLERRLQLICEELSGGLSAPANGEQAGPRDGDDAPPFPGEVHIDADSISAFAHGFYPREYDSKGVMFRWTGNGPLCELRFFIDRGADRQFRLSVGDTAEDVLSKISGFVDYTPIPLTRDENEKRTYLVGTVPKRAHTRLAVASFLLGEAAPKKKKSANGHPPAWLGFKFYAFDVT
jgi:hypothetical protein